MEFVHSIESSWILVRIIVSWFWEVGQGGDVQSK
jgi:hypothetical protein